MIFPALYPVAEFVASVLKAANTNGDIGIDKVVIA
jgi:hypothetical protein